MHLMLRRCLASLLLTTMIGCTQARRAAPDDFLRFTLDAPDDYSSGSYTVRPVPDSDGKVTVVFQRLDVQTETFLLDGDIDVLYDEFSENAANLKKVWQSPEARDATMTAELQSGNRQAVSRVTGKPQSFTQLAKQAGRWADLHDKVTMPAAKAFWWHDLQRQGGEYQLVPMTEAELEEYRRQLREQGVEDPSPDDAPGS